MTALPVTRPAHEVRLGANLEPVAGPVTRERRRVSILALVTRPSRTSQRERLLDRYRWANAGLRERLAEVTRQHEQTLDAIAVIVDEEARVIGHAHPVIVRVRAQLDAAAQERPA